MTKTKEKLVLDQNPLKKHFYKTFFLPLMLKQNDMIHDIEVKDHQKIINIPKKNNSQNRYRSTSKDRFSYNKNTTPPKYTRSRYDNYDRDSPSYRSPYRFSYKSSYRRDYRHRHRSRSYSKDNNNFTRYTSSFRPPSRHRDSKFSRSRSHSNTRTKTNTIQPQTQNDSINFEVKIYHPTEMANSVTPTRLFHSFYLHNPSKQNQCDYPSRLEISLILDSGASISVLNYPTYVTIAKHLNIKLNNTLSSSKTLTVANQTEVPIIQYVTVTLNYTNRRRLPSIYNTFRSSRYKVQSPWYTLL